MKFNFPETRSDYTRTERTTSVQSCTCQRPAVLLSMSVNRLELRTGGSAAYASEQGESSESLNFKFCQKIKVQFSLIFPSVICTWVVHFLQFLQQYHAKLTLFLNVSFTCFCPKVSKLL